MVSVSRTVVNISNAHLCYFGKLDPDRDLDPHKSKKLDPDPQ
jgi:hypothetical protein